MDLDVNSEHSATSLLRDLVVVDVMDLVLRQPEVGFSQVVVIVVVKKGQAYFAVGLDLVDARFIVLANW